jgi:hypothetical protein
VASRNVLVTLSRPEDPDFVIAETRPDGSGGFNFDGLGDGVYVVRTYRTDPDTPGQAPSYKGLYVDTQTTVRVPDVCSSGGVDTRGR